jgi:lipopolysaccharide export system protein LptA
VIRSFLQAVRRPRAAAAIVAAAAVLAGGARIAAAETADREKPINWIADSADVNAETKVGTLTGNVVITQGTMVIHADKITFRQNPDNSMSATAWGNPITFRQKRDGFDEYFEGFAQRAEYDGTKQLLELFDRALLRRNQDEIRSNYISYNTATELAKAEGRGGLVAAPESGGAGARVRGVFQPKSDTPLPGKGKDAAQPAAKSAAKGAQAPPPVVPPPAELKSAPDLAPQSPK